jgi:hypothetical protein
LRRRLICGPWSPGGSALSGRQHESDQAPGKRSGQSGVDCGCQVVVPFGVASHADRLWADGQATAVHPPWDDGHPPRESRRRLGAVRRAEGRADEGAGESNRRSARPRRSRNVSLSDINQPATKASAGPAITGDLSSYEISKQEDEVTQDQDLRYVKSLFMRLRTWWHRRRSSHRDRTQTTDPPAQ